MRTSFHHQPEAQQHPNFPLSTSGQADYPIFRTGLIESGACRPIIRWHGVRKREQMLCPNLSIVQRIKCDIHRAQPYAVGQNHAKRQHSRGNAQPSPDGKWAETDDGKEDQPHEEPAD